MSDIIIYCGSASCIYMRLSNSAFYIPECMLDYKYNSIVGSVLPNMNMLMIKSSLTDFAVGDIFMLLLSRGNDAEYGFIKLNLRTSEVTISFVYISLIILFKQDSVVFKN